MAKFGLGTTEGVQGKVRIQPHSLSLSLSIWNHVWNSLKWKGESLANFLWIFGLCLEVVFSLVSLWTKTGEAQKTSIPARACPRRELSGFLR
jgi:hypothetical protein